MMRQAIYPAGSEAIADQMKLSPIHQAGGLLFLTGMTGRNDDGSMPDDAETQFHNVFRLIGGMLASAGVGLDAMVEMTSYHVGLREHFDLFSEVRGNYVDKPYPAWTAIEAAELHRPGAVVEIRVVAAAGNE